MGAPGFLQERPDIGALLPEGGGEQPAAADRTPWGQNAMGNALLKHRPAMAVFISMVDELIALLLILWPRSDLHEIVSFECRWTGEIQNSKKSLST